MSTTFVFFFFFPLHKWGMAKLRGPQHTQNMSYPLPEFLFPDEDWIAERLNTPVMVPQEIHGRVLKCSSPKSQMKALTKIPLFLITLFLSDIFSKHFFCLVHWGSWSQLVASTTEFHPLCFFCFVLFFFVCCPYIELLALRFFLLWILPYCAEGDSFRSTMFCHFWPVR